MFRKTLTILSLIGLLLSVGAWGVSYAWVEYFSSSRNEQISLCAGCLCWYDFTVSQANDIIHVSMPRVGLAAHGFQGFHTEWLPYVGRGRYTDQAMSVGIPLWIPTAAFISLIAICRPFALHRRRRRRKLGLCVKCGYDLRGSEDRCPECGTEFQIRTLPNSRESG